MKLSYLAAVPVLGLVLGGYLALAPGEAPIPEGTGLGDRSAWAEPAGFATEDARPALPGRSAPPELSPNPPASRAIRPADHQGRNPIPASAGIIEPFRGPGPMPEITSPENESPTGLTLSRARQELASLQSRRSDLERRFSMDAGAIRQRQAMLRRRIQARESDSAAWESAPLMERFGAAEAQYQALRERYLQERDVLERRAAQLRGQVQHLSAQGPRPEPAGPLSRYFSNAFSRTAPPGQ